MAFMPALAPLVDQDKLRKLLRQEARLWGRSVFARRDSLHLTLDQVAQLAGTTSQTVHKVERGEIVARDHLRIALALALGTTVEALFPMPDRAMIIREASAA